MAKGSFAALPGRTKGRALLLVLFLLLLYLLLPRLGDFSSSFSVLRGARLDLVLAALLLVVVTYALAAGVYQSLALRLRGVQYRHTLLVQFATAFTNRLLPAGLGGLALNVQYLRKHGHRLSEATAIAGLNNVLGMVGHVLLFGVIIIVQPEAITGRLELPRIPIVWLVGAAVGLVLASNVLLFSRVRRSLRKGTREVVVYARAYRKQPEKVLVALLCSMALTSCYVLVFYLCAYGVGINLSLWSIFAVFTVGVLVGTVTPTPGGLVGAEAGLVAGLVAYQVDPAAGLAAVLLFRFLTYWLPLFSGFLIFLLIRNRYI
jgi:uncharacterized protein (TIRG00374 family)